MSSELKSGADASVDMIVKRCGRFVGFGQLSRRAIDRFVNAIECAMFGMLIDKAAVWGRVLRLGQAKFALWNSKVKPFQKSREFWNLYKENLKISGLSR